MEEIRQKLSSKLEDNCELKKLISRQHQQHQQHQQQQRRVISKCLGPSFLLLLVVATSVVSTSPTGDKQTIEKSSEKDGERPNGRDVAAIQAELNSIIQQHDGSSAGEAANQRKLAETIISRLMLDNLTGGLSNYNQEELVPSANQDLMDEIMITIPAQAGASQLEPKIVDDSVLLDQSGNPLNGYDAIRMRKFWNLIQQYYDNTNKPYGQLPGFTGGSEQATMKRAAARINYLNQRNFPRHNYDFGLGKRHPDDRFGDAGSASTGLVPAMGQFGKRPSHRYDFGLGKRVASVSRNLFHFPNLFLANSND